LAKFKALETAGVINTEGYYTVGGRTAIDFANTGTRIGVDGEGLQTLEHLLTFLKSLTLLHEDEASSFHMFMFQNPARCEQVMADLLEIRKNFCAALEQMASGWPADPMFVSDLNDKLSTFPTKLVLEPTSEGYDLQEKLIEQGPEQLLFPILKDVADQVNKVRKCASDTCELFFINTSRNGRRRWCSMSTCGNRAKVNAYLKRKEA
jgi:hypothetical protein